MAIGAGTRLGPYEVLAPIGAGGMGEVYMARDTRLGRDVAIKILPPAFADDPDRRARFEREAQAVAALSHPNILAIYDTGAHEGQLYAVMELLRGQTLRERLATAVPVRKAIEIAIEIARGLAAAHAKGLVHRDLKPENVFLLEDGQVKILDFGLARSTGQDEPKSDKTRTVLTGTDPGTVLGTVGYMAPEQVRGQAVDARADLFAFGAVLYEMLSGRRAFQRNTAADTMSAVLNEDPPEFAGSRPDLPPALDRIVRHCLEKNANERFQNARDVAFALDSLSGSGSGSATTASSAMPPLPAARRGWRMGTVALVPVAAAAALAAGVLIGRTMTPALPDPTFVAKTFEPQAICNARFLPDGRTIVVSAALQGNRPSLFEIRADAQDERPFGPAYTHLLSVASTGEMAVLTGARAINHRTFHGTLARMALDGAPRPVADDVRDADWAPDGSALAVVHDLGGRDRIEFPSGKALHEAAGYLSDLRVSPDGRRVAFMEHPRRWDDRGFVKVVDESGRVTTLAGEHPAEEGVAWSPDGKSVYFSAVPQGGSDYQVFVAPASGAAPARRLVSTPGSLIVLDAERDGRLIVSQDNVRYGVVAKAADQSDERDLTWLDQSWGIDIAPDGKSVAFTDGHAGDNYGVVVRTTEGSPVSRLGEGDANGFSRDGRWVAAVVSSPPAAVVYPVGAGNPIRMERGPIANYESVKWFPDGRSVLLYASEPSKPARLYRQPLSGGGPTPILPEGVGGTANLGVTGAPSWGSTPTARGIDTRSTAAHPGT